VAAGANWPLWRDIHNGQERALAEGDDITSKLIFVPTESGAARFSSIQSSRH
jgi:hypothetical protein